MTAVVGCTLQPCGMTCGRAHCGRVTFNGLVTAFTTSAIFATALTVGFDDLMITGWTLPNVIVHASQTFFG